MDARRHRPRAARGAAQGRAAAFDRVRLVRGVDPAPQRERDLLLAILPAAGALPRPEYRMIRPIRIAPDGSVRVDTRAADAMREVYALRAVERRQRITAAHVAAWLADPPPRPEWR